MRSAKSKPSGQFRIIAGEWRGRRVGFPAIDGLRPSTDRVRETLFNWLAPHIKQTRCLDLFAGSGALGLEALSRGAASCDFIDQQSVAVRAIRDHLAVLGAEPRGQAFTQDALTWRQERPYDIVFVDPPFKTDLVTPALNHLETAGLLAETALVYIEQPQRRGQIEQRQNLTCLREKTAGEVRYQLLAYNLACKETSGDKPAMAITESPE